LSAQITAGVPTPSSNLAFRDDFNGTTVDWSKWRDSSSAEADGGHGNKGNKQSEWNQGKNCSVSNGVLRMTAKPDNITSAFGTHYDWSSCLLSSSRSFEFRYGYMEIRSKLPAPRGFWPSFWTWQVPGNHSHIETDVYELFSEGPLWLYLTQHSGKKGGCQLNLKFNPTAAFHTYGADIQATGTTFYIDGVKVCTAAGTSTGPVNINISNFVNSAVPPVTGSVGVQEVDYVRVWQ